MSSASVAILIEGGEAEAAWPVSTARAGIGGGEGSYRTPPGWHRVHRRIGEGAEAGTVFVSREPTGEMWRGEARDDDLILTRILTLDGLEDGVNRGAGLDSLERYIYLHGTNHERLLGRPASHGCVRLSNADVVSLFDRVREGDLRADRRTWDRAPFPIRRARALPLRRAWRQRHERARPVPGDDRRARSGSDRAFDRGERAELRAQLERLGIAIMPQDGSGVTADCAALVVSTAVEEQVPDVAAARARGMPIVHRSELLAHFVAAHRTVAVTGTSGKSTVAAMIFEILRGAGRDPSVITGGDLRLLQAQGLPGNALAGGSDLLVVEADESDGSLVRYAPAVGVILNLQRDHKEMAEVAAMFAVLRARAREALVVGEDANLDALRRRRAPLRLRTARRHSRRRTSSSAPQAAASPSMTLPSPCRCPAGTTSPMRSPRSPLRARSACRSPTWSRRLRAFRGVGRRFQTVGDARGVEVIDDFAHNADKIAAALATAQLDAPRVLAVYQPHGYGPTRFLRHDFVDTFARELRPGDRLWMLEVFYAGGTATPRLLRGRHRRARSPSAASRPSSRRPATGSPRASPRRRAPATWSW